MNHSSSSFPFSITQKLILLLVLSLAPASAQIESGTTGANVGYIKLGHMELEHEGDQKWKSGRQILNETRRDQGSVHLSIPEYGNAQFVIDMNRNQVSITIDGKTNSFPILAARKSGYIQGAPRQAAPPSSPSPQPKAPVSGVDYRKLTYIAVKHAQSHDVIVFLKRSDGLWQSRADGDVYPFSIIEQSPDKLVLRNQARTVWFEAGNTTVRQQVHGSNFRVVYGERTGMSTSDDHIADAGINGMNVNVIKVKHSRNGQFYVFRKVDPAAWIWEGGKLGHKQLSPEKLVLQYPGGQFHFNFTNNYVHFEEPDGGTTIFGMMTSKGRPKESN